LLDESGFLLQPTRRRTWAPRGQTPIQRCWARHDRLSVCGALTCSPQRQRLGLYFRLHPHNIRTPDMRAFLSLLQRHLRRPLLLILDRWSVHRGAVRGLAAQRPPWLVAVAWLPPYAPELNPTEQVWNQTKYRDLANYLAEDLGALHEAVGFSLASQRYRPPLLRSYFRYAKLKL
jgi:transposase